MPILFKAHERSHKYSTPKSNPMKDHHNGNTAKAPVHDGREPAARIHSLEIKIARLPLWDSRIRRFRSPLSGPLRLTQGLELAETVRSQKSTLIHLNSPKFTVGHPALLNASLRPFRSRCLDMLWAFCPPKRLSGLRSRKTTLIYLNSQPSARHPGTRPSVLSTLRFPLSGLIKPP
jgi:hypothetical protein